MQVNNESEREFWEYLASIRDNMDKYDLPTRFIWHHSTEPEVYQMFEGFALQMYAKNPLVGSAWLIANRMRWETYVNTTTEPYNISNDFIALYSRLFMARYPQAEGFFKTRPMKRISEN